MLAPFIAGIFKSIRPGAEQERRVSRLERHQRPLETIYDRASFEKPYNDKLAAGALRLWVQCQLRIKRILGQL